LQQWYGHISKKKNNKKNKKKGQTATRQGIRITLKEKYGKTQTKMDQPSAKQHQEKRMS